MANAAETRLVSASLIWASAELAAARTAQTPRGQRRLAMKAEGERLADGFLEEDIRAALWGLRHYADLTGGIVKGRALELLQA
ncbi:MAG: hypothetical protein JWM24_630 [Solirubrobacterales bacterium]|nr:hypothetical protein [Solirubrobacterales bacterium]